METFKKFKNLPTDLVEFLKRHCCRYLVQRYVGQFLATKLESDQLEVILRRGNCALTDIQLNVERLNQLAAEQNWPFEFLDGYIESVSITIPWKTFLRDPCTVDVSSLRIIVQPKQQVEEGKSMFESMWSSSMTSSMFLGKECAMDFQEIDTGLSNTAFAGVDAFAEMIDSIMGRIKVSLIDSEFQVRYFPKGSPMGIGVVFNVDHITYFDESTNDPSKEEATKFSEADRKKAYFEQSYKAKTTTIEGITISTIEISHGSMSQSSMSESRFYDNEDAASGITHSSNASEISETRSTSSEDQPAFNEESDVIMFGKFGGKIELIVRLKRTEDLEGPKVSIELDAAPLLLFLSPRQVHLLCELAAGIANPDTEMQTNPLSGQYGGKPMTAADYEKIQRDLQNQHTGPNFHLGGIVGGHGWATGTIDGSDIDENFVPFGARYTTGLYESALSGSSTMESSFSSSVTSSCVDTNSRTRKKIHKIDTDPTAEIYRFEVHVASLAVILLHEDLLTESSGPKSSLVPSTVKQMQTTAASFFETAASVFALTDFTQIHSGLDKACRSNHLRLLGSPVHLEGDGKTTSKAFAIGGYLEATKLELTECLYQTQEGGAQHFPLIIFTEGNNAQFEASVTAKPSLKLNFEHLEKSTRSKVGPKTDLILELYKCLLELDITIMDRISALLNPQKICVVTKMTNQWGANVASPTKDSRIDLKLTSPSTTVKLRFPVPDFRPPHDRMKMPWWRRHVRPDFLLLAMTGAVFQTSFQTSQDWDDYTLRCKSLNVSYQGDSNANPEPVGKAGYEDKAFASIQDGYSECSLNIKIFPPKKHNLDDSIPTAQDPMTTSTYGIMEDERKEPTGPFSFKRVVHESDTPHNKTQKDDSKELLVPGTKAEIDEFKKSTTASALIRVHVNLPTVSLALPNKRVYETIYNRIFNDLLLWEPNAPKPRTSTATYDNVNYGPFGMVEMEGQEVFRLCNTAIHYDSETESDEETEMNTNIFYSAIGSGMKFSQNQVTAKAKKESYLTLNLEIGRGLLSLCTPVRDTASNIIPNQQGEFLVNVEGASLFMVSGFEGDMDLGFTCLELHRAQLYHCDFVSTPSHSPPLKDIGAKPGTHLHATIYGSEVGMLADCKNRGGNNEMVTLCVKVKSSHETHHVKNISIAIGFNKVTLRHRMCNEPNSWISQFIDFFNVDDYPIHGYNPKEVLTELFVHFWDSAIDYRPKYLPLRAAITLGSFSISSHLSAEVNSSTLRFIAEECSLFLSQKGVKKDVIYSGPVDLKRDYVSVIDLGLFEISLKTSDKKNMDTPHFDLRASNNIIHLRTCADSARALTQLIQYLANDGDLVPPEEGSTSGSAFSSPRHSSEPELVSVAPPQEINNISESQHRQVSDLLQDALEDVDEAKTTQTAKTDLYTYNGTKIYYFPDESTPSPDPFNPLPQVTQELGRVPSQPNVSDSDDEFCFIGDNIFPKNGEPEIKWLSDEPVRIVENYFTVPSEKCDPLKTPKNFPTPTTKYTLCEMTIVWHMFGGSDFTPLNKEKKKTVNFADCKLKDSVSFSNSQKETVVIESEKAKKKSWTHKGGPNRDHTVLLELQLNKIRVQHEVYPESSSKASRQVFIVSEIELRDRLKSSQMNKFLYQYISQSKPKQSNANMLTIKTVHIRPDPQLRRQECCLKISVLPLRLNVDQDALQFLISFCTELGTGGKDDDLQVATSKHNTPVHQPPVMTVTDENAERLQQEEAKRMVDENLLILLEENKSEQNWSDDSSQVSSNEEDGPIYFRKVIFSPDVPIRLDYQGKHLDLKTHGPVQGLLMGLAQLNCTELRLKRISHRHGLLGVEKLMMFLVKEWVNDIKKNQIPNLLVSVGFMTSFFQLFVGIRDLFCMPFEQYKKNGRFFRGLHRGANSFSTSTAMAALELTTRLIHLIQITAETAFDMLTPGPSVRINPKTKNRRKRYKQPKDIREGVTNAYILVKEGIEETATNILQVASHEHEQKGYSGAVGGVIRQIPPTIIKPIIIASEATTNVLGGMKCQLVPDARKEAHEKWRSDDTYDSYE